MTNENMYDDFRLVIASLPDRKNCVCEVYYKRVQWVEISQEDTIMNIQFYPHPTEAYWEFPVDVALDILQKAKKKFVFNER
jgi:hypothetical protein